MLEFCNSLQASSKENIKYLLSFWYVLNNVLSEWPKFNQLKFFGHINFMFNQFGLLQSCKTILIYRVHSIQQSIIKRFQRFTDLVVSVKKDRK